MRSRSGRPPAGSPLPRLLSVIAVTSALVAGCSGASSPGDTGSSPAGSTPSAPAASPTTTPAASPTTGATETQTASPAATPTTSPTAAATTAPAPTPTGPPVLTTSAFTVNALEAYDEPWAATFLGSTGYLAVTERPGRLLLRAPDGQRITVSGVPEVAAAGQGGLGDVITAPGYDGTSNRTIYLSWAERGDGGTGAAVGRAELVIAADGGSARLQDLRVIWRQTPKTSGSGHYGHRLAFDPSGEHLFVTSGERQKMDPAQDLGTTLGKIVRLTPDGQAAPGNPFANRGGVAAQIWSYGHRNPLGIAFDEQGRLWSSEMGPRGGDELNLITRGSNYGWPRASDGSHYDGRDIPDHRSGDGFVAPTAFWTPSISPAGLMIYTGSTFPWRGDAFLPALSGRGLARVALDGTTVTARDFWDLEARIRDVVQGPDGLIYLLEDGPNGRLLQLAPR